MGWILGSANSKMSTCAQVVTVLVVLAAGTTQLSEGWSHLSHTHSKSQISFPKCRELPVSRSLGFIISGSVRGRVNSPMRGGGSPWSSEGWEKISTAIVLQHMFQHLVHMSPYGNTHIDHQHKLYLQQGHNPRCGHQQQIGPGCHHGPGWHGPSSSIV